MKQQHLSILLLLSLVAGLAACQNEDDSLPRSFTVRSIEYAFMEGDGESTYTVDIGTEVYTNALDTPHPVEIAYSENAYAESSFSFDDPEALAWVAGADTVWVQDVSTMGGRPYADKFNSLPFLPVTYRVPVDMPISEMFNLQPHSWLKLDRLLYFQKLTATYRLQVEESPSGEVREFTGTLTKTWPLYIETYVSAGEGAEAPL